MKILRTAGGVLLAPMILLSACPGQCDPAPAPPPAPAPTPRPGDQFRETFDGPISGWTFRHVRYAPPVGSDDPSSATVSGGRLVIVGADQNYGDATMRAPVKYDLRGGGEVRVTMSDDGRGNPLVGFATVLLSARPQDGLMSDIAEWPDYGPSPTEGVQVQLRDNCNVRPNSPVMVEYPSQRTQRPGCAVEGLGARTVVFNSRGATVYNAAGTRLTSFSAVVPPTGYVQLGVHNHASIKYAQQAAVTGTFDNLTFPTS